MRKGKQLLWACPISLLLIASGSVMADDIDKRWYIAPSVSYIVADDNREADDDFGLKLGIGKPLGNSWNLELSGVGDNLDQSKVSEEFKQRGLILDGLYFFNRDPGFAPYGVIGAGALNTDFAGDDTTNGIVNVGVGFMRQLTDHGLSVRADIRHRWDFDDASINGEDYFGDWILNLGLTIPLSAKKAAAVAVVTAVAEPVAMEKKDSDGDGIPDEEDSCQNTPAGAQVNASGCELDSDDDGVADTLDACPNSPAGVTVNADGCEIDSDGDGIADSLDQCRESEAGAKVDAQGCEIPEVIILNGVNFETGSAHLTKGSSVVLDEAAETLLRHPNMKVEIAGYTDNRGSIAFNRRLSQLRAKSVLDYLVSKGVAAENLSARGYGPDDPIADNDTVEGRAANRRVELHILGRQ